MFLETLENVSVTRLPVYVIRSASSSANRSRMENKEFLLYSPNTASTFSSAAPLCIAPDALLSIQYGQPLIWAVLTQTKLRSSGVMSPDS